MTARQVLTSQAIISEPLISQVAALQLAVDKIQEIFPENAKVNPQVSIGINDGTNANKYNINGASSSEHVFPHLTNVPFTKALFLLLIV
nr:hypothetical protein [Aeromonas veronii]